MSDRVEVAEYGDLAPRVDLSPREIDTLVAALNADDRPVLALEKWLADKKDLRALENERRLYAVSVRGESEKAWHVATGEHDDWVPKSQGELFVRASGAGEISTPTKTLSEFGNSGGRA